MTEMDGKQVIVITGGTGALGRWVVREFVGRGIRVHAPWVVRGERDEADAFLREELAGQAPIRIHWKDCDVTDPGAVDDLVEAVRSEHGRLDALINGVGGFAMGPVEETDPETWQRMMALNATSAFLCSRAVAPAMKERGRGRIVNIASMPALERGAGSMSAYAPAKAAVLNLTYSLAEELRPDGITVNAIVPTVIDTPANREAMPDADASTWLHPREIARVLAFLVSDDGAVVNGAAIRLGKE